VTIAAAFAALAAALSGGAGARSLTAPQNTAPPTITGVPEEGETLVGDRGQWTGTEPITYTPQWRRCDAAGAACVSIVGATKTTYTVKAEDVGHTIRLQVRASNKDGNATATSKPTGVVKAALPNAPRNTTAPSIAGVAKVGEILTGSKGQWEGTEPIAYTYQWQRCDTTGGSCADISGASQITYTLTSADVGNTVRFRVTASNTAGRTTAFSAATAVVAGVTPPPPPPPPPAANKRPTIVVLSARILGKKAYVRVRICDDSRRNVTIIERDSKPGALSYTRRFRTLTAPNPCGVYGRTWFPAPRFLTHGRFTVTLWARDAFGLISLPATRAFVR
jgi:hypothetical protein